MIHPNQNFLNNFNNIQAVSEKQDLTNKLPENRKASTAPLMLIEDVKAKLQKALKEKENIQVKITEEAKPEEITTQKVIVEQVLPEIKTEGPLVYKNGVLSLDSTELKTALAGYSQQFLQDAVTKFTANSTPGGGAVGIKFDDGVNKTNLTRSVNNLIFKGPGVQLTRKGKDIEVYVASAINTEVDFPRESTMLSVFTLLSSLSQQVDEINTSLYPSSFTSIGGGEWNII
jgi:hypothetical protein